MKLPRVELWGFSSAPERLRLLYDGSETPDWLALVPRELDGLDLHQAMTGSARLESVYRYSMPNGDVTYIGASLLSGVVTKGGGAKSARHKSR